jgi:hypothetical protein
VRQNEELVERSLPRSLTIVYLSALGGNLKGLGRCYDPCMLVRQIEEASWDICYMFYDQRVGSGFKSISGGISVSKQISRLCRDVVAECRATARTV